MSSSPNSFTVFLRHAAHWLATPLHISTRRLQVARAARKLHRLKTRRRLGPRLPRGQKPPPYTLDWL